jgi:hypothetical protein
VCASVQLQETCNTMKNLITSIPCHFKHLSKHYMNAIKLGFTTMCFRNIAFENLDIPTIQGKTSRNFSTLEVYQNQ